jgi:hypothetical protein
MPLMDMFPSELRHNVPPLESQEGITDPIVYLKFFCPDSPWVWYVTEGSPEEDDFIFFGFVAGIEEEWGNFSLLDLSETRGPSGRPVERDPHFEAGPFSRVVAKGHPLALRGE